MAGSLLLQHTGAREGSTSTIGTRSRWADPREEPLVCAPWGTFQGSAARQHADGQLDIIYDDPRWLSDIHVLMPWLLMVRFDKA